MKATTSNSPYSPDQLALLRDLYTAGCVLVGDEVQRRFGLRSPIYINMRENLYAQPELLWRVGGEFAWKIVELAGAAASEAGRACVPQTVVGIPDTATPLAMTTALFSWGNRTNPRITFALLRKEAKRYPGHEPNYWLGPRVESSGAAANASLGETDDQREFNLIDDVVASGLTKRAAAEKMRAEGIPLTRIIVLFDRGQGDGLREEGFALHSIFNLRTVVDYYAAEGLITSADHTRIAEFLSTRRFDRT